MRCWVRVRRRVDVHSEKGQDRGGEQESDRRLQGALEEQMTRLIRNKAETLALDRTLPSAFLFFRSSHDLHSWSTRNIISQGRTGWRL